MCVRVPCLSYNLCLDPKNAWGFFSPKGTNASWHNPALCLNHAFMRVHLLSLPGQLISQIWGFVLVLASPYIQKNYNSCPLIFFLQLQSFIFLLLDFNTCLVLGQNCLFQVWIWTWFSIMCLFPVINASSFLFLSPYLQYHLHYHSFTCWINKTHFACWTNYHN